MSVIKLEAVCALFMGVHRPAAATERVVLNDSLGTNLSSPLGLNSAQCYKCFAPSREENVQFLVGLSKASRIALRRHWEELMISICKQISVCKEIEFAHVCLRVNVGSDDDLFSQLRSAVAFPFPPTEKIDPAMLSTSQPAWWICWAGPSTPRSLLGWGAQNGTWSPDVVLQWSQVLLCRCPACPGM